MTTFRPAVVFVGFLSFFLTPGCQIDYFAHLVVGELASLAGTVPVEAALDDPLLAEEEKNKLRLVQQVRAFGIERITLFAGEAYTVFEANGTEPAAYVLSASARDSLTPFRWDFPFVGLSEAKGFFDRDMGQREVDLLLALGFDVFYARADGFSTLGLLPDPVRQSNLQLDEIDLAELILHEMTHSTVSKLSDLNFTESLATFVGRAAAQAWFDETYGPDSSEAAAAGVRFADKVVIDEYVNFLFAAMTAYYQQSAAEGATAEAIIAGRQAPWDEVTARFASEFLPRLSDSERWRSVGELELNNARLLAAIRYQGSLSDYQAVFEMVGGSFPAALAVFAEATTRPDSREYLRDWVGATGED